MLSSPAGGWLDVCAISLAFLTSALDDGGWVSRRAHPVSYRGREHIVWEPYGDNSRWWIGPEDESAPLIPLDEVERAIASP
jgi:hypothetical protein